MAQRLLSQKLNKQHESIRDLLQKCVSLTEKCSDSEASKVLWDRLSHLQSAALFVIVGEVKSGKSSFVNALLGEDICEVAPDPCTAVIQELVYGEERAKTALGDNWERVSLPKDVLNGPAPPSQPPSHPIQHPPIETSIITKTIVNIMILFITPSFDNLILITRH